MATKLTAILEFPADAKTVFGMFGDSSYLELKRAQSEQGTFSVTETQIERLICVTRSLDDIPETYQKFLGSDLMLQEEQTWKLDSRSTFQADLKITIVGKPINISGTMTVKNAESGSELNLDVEVNVSIPLFGAMAENFIKEKFGEIIAAEQAIGLQWLSTGK